MTITDDQRKALQDLATAPTSETRRPTSPRMEHELAVIHPVLDHGFVRLVDYMGTEDSVVQAARVSYSAGTKTKRDDRALIRYMVRHAHTSPLEMLEVKLHCKMPIFVARQWIRHRTANVNEMSGRYSVLPAEFYVPDLGRIQKQSTANKQGSEGSFDEDDALHIQAHLRDCGKHEFSSYGWLTSVDLARELARINLPLSTYTEWYWKIDLHNLLHFLSLRMDPHAQYEIRVYAEVIGKMVQAWVPTIWEAFEDYHPRMGGHTFSRQELRLLRIMAEEVRYTGWLKTKKSRQAVADDYDLGSPRERKAFWKALGLLEEG